MPTANAASTALIEEWAAKERVEVQIDYITTQGNKLLLTEQAESPVENWARHLHLSLLGTGRPRQAARAARRRHGPVDRAEWGCQCDRPVSWQVRGALVAAPATRGSNVKGPCSRIDLMKNMPASMCRPCIRPAASPKAEAWTLDAFLEAAQACHKAGFPFGIGLGTTTDLVDSAGAIFDAFGAQLVDAQGKVTVKTDAVRQALDYYTRLARFLPADAPAWDDASTTSF